MSLQETPSRTGKRAIKFSPANIEKIKSFVAQGVNRNKIAERLGVTVGSLKSRVLGWESACEGYSYGRRPVAAGSSTYARHIGMVAATPPKFEIVLHRRGTTQTTVLPLTDSHIARLGLEAWVQDSNIVRLMTEAVTGAIKRGMIQEILQKDISVADA